MRLCIVGTSRCGTTLTRALLHEHSALKMLNETHWLPKMVEVAGNEPVQWQILHQIAAATSWDSGKDLYSVNAMLSGHQDKEEFLAKLESALRAKGNLTIQEFSEIFAETCFGAGCSWGDKTPDYGFYMRTIQSLWPRCRFLHMTRDGIHTAQSMSKHSGIQLMVSAGFDNWCALSYKRVYEQYQRAELPLEAYVASWRRRMQHIRREAAALGDGTYLEVRYERLLREPRSTLCEIANWLRLDADAAWLDRACALIRRPATRPTINLQAICNLDAEDLCLLNREGSLRDVLLLPCHATNSEVIELFKQGQAARAQGNREFCIRAGLSILATSVSESVRTRAAEELLGKAMHSEL